VFGEPHFQATKSNVFCSLRFSGILVVSAGNDHETRLVALFLCSQMKLNIIKSNKWPYLCFREGGYGYHHGNHSTCNHGSRGQYNREPVYDGAE